MDLLPLPLRVAAQRTQCTLLSLLSCPLRCPLLSPHRLAARLHPKPPHAFPFPQTDFLPWQDEDAPQLVAQTILDVCSQKLSFNPTAAGASDVHSCAAPRLAQGWGEGACVVLNFLCDRVLSARKWKVQTPSYVAVAKDAAKEEDALVEEQNEVKDEVR